MVEEELSVQGQDVGEKLAFPQQLSEKAHVETWAGGHTHTHH